MKTMFTFVLVTMLTSAAFAYDEAKLTISVPSSGSFVVVIDGRNFQSAGNTIAYHDIRPGNHTVKIYKESRGYSNARNRSRAIESRDLVYSSTLYVKPDHHTTITVNHGGRVRVTEKEIRNRDDRDRGRDRDRDRYDRDDRYDDRDNRYGMRDYEFNAAIREIRSQWMGSKKMTLASNTVMQNRLSVAQVREVLISFIDDRDKLELAKLAYRNTTDRHAFSALYSVFDSRSSRQELERYIRSYRY